MKKGLWTEDETNILRQMRESGESNLSIAKELGRSVKSIEQKVHIGNVGNPFSIPELEVLTASGKDHPLDVYRRTFPESKRTTADLFSALGHKSVLIAKLKKMREKEKIKLIPQVKIKTESRTKTIIDDDELRVIIGIRNELSVIQNQLEEMLHIQKEIFELFKEVRQFVKRISPTEKAIQSEIFSASGIQILKQFANPPTTEKERDLFVSLEAFSDLDAFNKAVIIVGVRKGTIIVKNKNGEIIPPESLTMNTTEAAEP